MTERVARNGAEVLYSFNPTTKPPIEGCSMNRKGPGFWGRTTNYHDWRYSKNWNGNEPDVLPFPSGSQGIPRDGWRCYHCGSMVWDESNEAYMVRQARLLYGVKPEDWVIKAVQSKLPTECNA